MMGKESSNMPTSNAFEIIRGYKYLIKFLRTSTYNFLILIAIANINNAVLFLVSE